MTEKNIHLHFIIDKMKAEDSTSAFRLWDSRN